MRKAAGIVVVIILLTGWRLHNRGSDDKQVLADMKALITELELSSEDTAYLNGIVDREHRLAFDGAYDMGSRRRGATFDEDKYVDAVFQAMIARCDKDKKKDLAGKLRIAHRIVLENEDE